MTFLVCQRPKHIPTNSLNMNRRKALIVLGSVFTIFAGCLNDNNNRGPDHGDDSSAEPILYEVNIPKVTGEEYSGGNLRINMNVTDNEITESTPALFEFTLENNSRSSYDLSTGSPWPFGVPIMKSDDGGDNIMLWSYKYEDSEHVATQNRSVIGVEDIEVEETIGGGETVTRLYELHIDTPHLESGEYQLDIYIEAHQVTAEVVVESNE